MSDKLTTLLARVEAATGADRQIDGDLAEALGLIPADSLGDTNISRWIRTEHGNRVFEAWSAPNLTGSVDAVLAAIELVLPGLGINMCRISGEGNRIQVREAFIFDADNDIEAGRDYWPTRPAALAILAALLTALLSKDPS